MGESPLGDYSHRINVRDGAGKISCCVVSHAIFPFLRSATGGFLLSGINVSFGNASYLAAIDGEGFASSNGITERIEDRQLNLNRLPDFNQPFQVAPDHLRFTHCYLAGSKAVVSKSSTRIVKERHDGATTGFQFVASAASGGCHRCKWAEEADRAPSFCKSAPVKCSAARPNH